MTATHKDFIWRIEDGSDNGAYSYMCYGEGQYYGDYHPGPYSDGIDTSQMRSEHLFGFRDVVQARRWFTSIHDLQDWERQHDAKLVVYRRKEVSDIQDGNNQTIFVPGSAAKVRLNATDLHRLRIEELVSKVLGEFATLSESVHGA